MKPKQIQAWDGLVITVTGNIVTGNIVTGNIVTGNIVTGDTIIKDMFDVIEGDINIGRHVRI